MIEKPPVTSEAPKLMERVVGFDDEQVAMASAFQDEALGEFERIAAIWDEIQEAGRAEAQGAGGREVWFDLFKRAMEFQERRAAIRDRFVEDVELLVTAEQQEAWDRFERRFYRKHLFGEAVSQYGSVDGVTVDVEEVAEAAELPDDVLAQVSPILDQYSRDLDRKLRSLESVVEENTRARMEAFDKLAKGEGWDMELMQTGADRMAELIDEIRDANLGAQRRITNELSTEYRDDFERVFNKTAFPSIYTDTSATARFAAALGREDLTAEQRSTIEGLQEQFRREVGAVRARLREAALEENPVDNLMSGGWGRGDDDEDEDKAREQVEELSDRYVQQIDGVLTPDQLLELGADDPTDWRNRSFDP